MSGFRLKAYEPTEQQVLFSILEALRYQQALGNVVWYNRMNSGATVTDDKHGRRFIRYGFKGCPDIIGMLPGGRSLYLEVKRPSGRIRPEQRKFINMCKDSGAAAGIVRSVEDAIEVIEQ